MELNHENNFDKMEVKLQPEDVKQEWSHIETAGVNYILDGILYKMGLCHIHESAHEILSMAWISSYFNGFQVLRPDVTIDGNEVNGFLIRNNNQLIAHCFNENEEDLFYEVRD